MSAALNVIRSSSAERENVPPLENGDCLTRAEFERRYEAMPRKLKAELIEGIVFISSPVRTKTHGRPHLILTGWLGQYIAKTPGLDEYGDNSTVRLDMDNEPQPDLFLNLPKHAGGQAELDEDDYLVGAPTLACEIAASSVSIDLHAKLHVYRRNQVREYLVWRTQDRAVDWFAWREGQYEALAPDAGIIKSEQFPGLWLNASALIEENLSELFKTLGWHFDQRTCEIRGEAAPSLISPKPPAPPPVSPVDPPIAQTESPHVPPLRATGSLT